MTAEKPKRETKVKVRRSFTTFDLRFGGKRTFIVGEEYDGAIDEYECVYIDDKYVGALGLGFTEVT